MTLWVHLRACFHLDFQEGFCYDFRVIYSKNLCFPNRLQKGCAARWTQKELPIILSQKKKIH